MLAVSVDEDWSQIRRFFAKGTPIPVLLDALQGDPEEIRHREIPRDLSDRCRGTRPLLLRQQARLVRPRSRRPASKACVNPQLPSGFARAEPVGGATCMLRNNLAKMST
jgi:hypothetical protein